MSHAAMSATMPMQDHRGIDRRLGILISLALLDGVACCRARDHKISLCAHDGVRAYRSGIYPVRPGTSTEAEQLPSVSRKQSVRFRPGTAVSCDSTVPHALGLLMN